ncbi:hypothetical protein ABZ770_24130 [Streptomyces sp. NPDC006654]|uniref:DedA family protein n=1 Tax=Streptomyces sp. NPDC006654 TaxID=3156897 RepID=UPI0033F90D82
MPWRRFLVFNALGAALWVGLWTTLAYVAGTHITAIYDEITRYQLYALLALGAPVAALALRHLLRRRHQD